MTSKHESSYKGKTHNRLTESGEDSNDGSNMLDILDVAAKLIAAGAVVAAAIIANNFQSSMTATSLLNQREQAESALRANMFHDLIGPIVGSEKNNNDITPDRERLLVELLALNFHEHFELKPIMLHVDDRLAHEHIARMDQAQRENGRKSLRSIARRVIQRQLAMLTEVENGLSLKQQACVYQLDITERLQQEKPQEIPQPCSRFTRYFDELITIKSSNGIYTLTFTISTKPDSWEDQTFPVSMRITSKEEVIPPDSVQTTNKAVENNSKVVSADHDFLLTWFDFPFTDNTLLADGTRFSLVIDQVRPEKKMATFKLIWFPQDYFSARERPTNYRQLREKLGITLRNP